MGVVAWWAVRLVLGAAGGMVCALMGGCRESETPYGVERTLSLASTKQQIWAVAPAVNLSGVSAVDPILQADIVYAQAQTVRGVTVIPVNRVVEVYQAMRIDRVQSEEQAAAVCQLLGADALLIPTVTAYDPFDPPKMGASLQLVMRGGGKMKTIDPRDLARQAAPTKGAAQAEAGFVQAVGMYDSGSGSVREQLARYVHGRHEPTGPMGARRFTADMERYAGFVYWTLMEEMLRSPALGSAGRVAGGGR